LVSEFRSAARALARWRAGLAVAVLTLAVGIGTTTSLYALVRVMLADFPGVPELDRVGRIYASSQALGIERSQASLNELESGPSHAASLAAIGAYAQADVTVGSGADERQVTAGYASPAFFRVMGVPPAAGRVFSDSEADASQPVVVLSEALWRKQFPDGRLTSASLSIGGIDRAVVGVMPAHFSYGFVGIHADLWLPLGRASRDAPAAVAIFARLRPGAGWPAAADELRAMKIARGPWTWRAIPIRDDTRFRAAGAYGFTLGPAIIVLLIACVNVACLLLARGIAREKELSVRRALGATRARVIRQLLQEHLLLAIAGGALGCGLAIALLQVIAAAFAAVQPALAARIAIDAGLLPVAVGASLVASLVFGVLPAIQISGRDVAASLNGVPTAHRVRIAGYGGRDLVVFIELASAVGLVVFAAMLLNLFSAMHLVKPTFPADRVVAMSVPARDADLISARVAAISGIARVTVVSGMPGGAIVRSQTVLVRPDAGRAVPVSRTAVAGAFLETLGLPITRGRSFDTGELRARTAVAILSETAARALAPTGEPIGMTIRMSGHPDTTATVIGVCRDAVDYGALSRAGLVPPDIYVPYGPDGLNALVLARVAADPHAVLRAMAAAVEAPAGTSRPRPALIAEDVGFRDHDLGTGQMVSHMLGGFALIALLLAGTGVFSVISQSVAQRTREFGIRMAVGATPRGVLGLVLARETKLIGAALATGAAFTLGGARAMFVELATLSVTAPAVWIALVGLCAGVAAVSVLLATYRITRLEPAVVLRRL
jgi:putative ABC transport system permease protein